MSQDVDKTPNLDSNEHMGEKNSDGHKEPLKDAAQEVGTSEKVAQELVEVKDKYVRIVAEMENMRRRMDRERVDLMKYALENILKDMLPTLDSLEKALPDTTDLGAEKATAHGDSAYYTGMIMVKKQLLEVLRKHGLEPIQSKGEAFDPNIHQAIQRVESREVDKDTVGDEYARGYTLHGRLLRPAMVSVLSPAGS